VRWGVCYRKAGVHPVLFGRTGKFSGVVKMTEAAPVALVAIDDDQQTLDVISEALSHDNRLAVSMTTKADEGINLVLTKRPKIVLLGLMRPSKTGMDLLETIVGQDPGIDVVLLTGHYSTEAAIEAIQRGACDCLTKPVRVDQLCERIQNLVGAAQARRRTLELDRELVEAFRFEGMVGRSPLMLDVYARITRIAAHFRTALILGATGTGKELAARALHARSPVRSCPFVAFNCAAVVDTLVEGELFGHVKGAFTGAVQDRVGLFEYANGGTVFLDEIGDMALGAQAKLLRVVQNQELQRVGSPILKKVDVRIVAATNRDLQVLMQKKRFREDLYYRLATVQIRLPTLAERREDLPFLQREFVERFAAQCGKNIRGITRRAQALLNRYTWPGNVRELENVLTHACMMADNDFVDVNDLPDYVRDPVRADLPSQGLRSLEEMDRRYARRIVNRLGGNKVKAAEVLGISRATLYRMLSDETASKIT
jgi:two-component system response regulator HydG